MYATTKRKAAVRCAAAEDEDFEDIADKKRDRKDNTESKGKKGQDKEDKRDREGDKGKRDNGSKRDKDDRKDDEERKSAKEEKPKKEKKEKEFAWMDSDDDEDAGGSQKDGGDAEGKEEDDTDVSEKALDLVQSFGRMVLLEPELKKRLRSGRMETANIIAVCRAMARTKFFDGDLLQELYSLLRKLLEKEKLDAAQTDHALRSFTILNAYDRKFFYAVVKAYKGKTATLDQGMRTEWVEMFKAVGHDRDKDFFQLLEAPPMPPGHPSYRKIRCRHFMEKGCALEKACAFSHDPRSPISFVTGKNEDYWRTGAVVTTNNQRACTGVYGGTRLTAPALGSWSMGVGGPLNPSTVPGQAVAKAGMMLAAGAPMLGMAQPMFLPAAGTQPALMALPSFVPAHAVAQTMAQAQFVQMLPSGGSA